MASKRDKLKMLNQASTPSPKENVTTIVDELVENYEKEEEKSTVILPEPPKSEFKTSDISSDLITVIDKSNVGRPKILQGVYKPISARLKMENYEHARKVGGRFGGMNAYINYLIEQDRKRKQ